MSKCELIWFQHFHKAGGSSLVRAAQDAGKRLYRPNKNGNPVLEDGEYIQLWSLEKNELKNWLKEQSASGIEFIACEWGYPRDLLSINFPNLRIISVMRHPVERVISNFYYDALNGYTKSRDILDYITLTPSYTRPDYYTRLLTGNSGNSATGEALEILKKFDAIAFLDSPSSFRAIESYIPNAGSIHIHSTEKSGPEFLQLKATVDSAYSAIVGASEDEIILYDALKKFFGFSV